MCSRVLPSSAFETQATTFTAGRQQQSPVVRTNNVLTRDDSGVFSSPSPLTPSRGPFTVFPLPPPSSGYTAAVSATATVSPSSPTPGVMSVCPEEEIAAQDGPPSHAISRAIVGDGAARSDGVQVPGEEDILLQAFTCRDNIGHDHWDNCGHAHCTTVRNQWQHLIECGSSCQTCQAFQRRVLLHAAHCQENSCVVSLCADAKEKLEGATNHRRPSTIQRSNSLQSSLGSPRPPKFLSLNNQGSLDDMSPMSPINYLPFPREFWESGAGLLPSHLQGSFSLRARDILREMERDGPLDQTGHGEETTNPLPAGVAAGQASTFTGGVLSPIKEDPCVDESVTCVYPSQVVLYPLEPEYLTQGRDGRYLHLRDYDICDHLGSGGFGTCTCARDHETNKMFVIKSNKFSEENMVESLKSESAILSRIPQHSNITVFLGAVLEEKGPERHCRLMMELADNGSLAGMLMNEDGDPEPLPLEQSLFYLYQILQGVFHLHSLSILHLDIKAENILVLEDGRRVKLTDFGTAAHIDDIVSSVSRLNGVTPHFTAPEIIKGDIPSFSSDIWSTVCVLIQLLTAEFPGGSKVPRESMIYTIGNYKDADIGKLISLSDTDLEEEVKVIFRDTLRVDPRVRPSALQLLSYPVLKEACNYEKYFDIECSQFAEQEEGGMDGAGLTNLDGAEQVCHTLPTSLPHLIVGPSDGDVSLDIPVRSKRQSQDSGVSSHYDRKQSEVYPVDPNDSGIDTPGQEPFAAFRGGLNLQTVGFRERAITEDREGEERLSSIPKRSQTHPDPPMPDYAALASQYRRRSHSATFNRPSSAGQEHRRLKFGCHYTDTNEDFFSLPTKSSLGGFVSQSVKVRPSFVQLIHSNSAPVVMSDKERGTVASGLGEKQGTVSGRLRRSSSEVYVDRGPDIDTPEEKKKRELALAAAAAKEPDDHESQLTAMTAALRLDQPHPPTQEAWPQRNHAPVEADRPDRGDQVEGVRPNEDAMARERGRERNQQRMPYVETQKSSRSGGYVRETLV